MKALPKGGYLKLTPSWMKIAYRQADGSPVHEGTYKYSIGLSCKGVCVLFKKPGDKEYKVPLLMGVGNAQRDNAIVAGATAELIKHQVEKKQIQLTVGLPGVKSERPATPLESASSAT